MLLVGTLRYNGISFGGSSQVTLQMETVEDDAKRTTVYVRHTLSVQCVISDQNDTGDIFVDLRNKLTEVGKDLTFEGQGAGSFSVNGGTQSDVKWGPHPRILAWAPVGSLRACEVRWTVEFCLPSCVFVSLSQANPLLAFNFGVGYSVDFKGATSRTLHGYLEIPMTRSGRVVPNSADNYRELITPSLPDEFQRVTQEYNLSLDKSRLDFTITDVEIPSDNPLPMGVAKIDARHSVGWSRSAAMMARSMNRISVSLELCFDQPMQLAYAVFVRIVKDRVDKARTNGKGVMLISVNCEEGIYDRTANFSAAYYFLCDAKMLGGGNFFSEMITKSGLFQALPSSPTWAQWAASQTGINGVRGYQGLTTVGTPDAIVDVCGAGTFPWTESENPGAFYGPPDPELGIVNTTPNTETSWMMFKSHPEITSEFPNCRQAILQPPMDPQAATNVDATVTMPSIGSPCTGVTYPAATGTPDVIQQNGQPRFWATVTGRAMRAGYTIPRPVYPTIGAATATLKWDSFTPSTAGNFLGVIVHCAEWTQIYELDKSPGPVGELKNPEQGNPGV